MILNRAGFITVFLLFQFLNLHPQSYSTNEGSRETGTPGRLTVNQDERLSELVRRHITLNRKNEGMQGYRIRIFAESGQGARTNATNARAKFFNNYPDVATYLDYDPPNFRVYLGDFRTRSEALKMQKKISRDYPNSFIISSRINLPPLN